MIDLTLFWVVLNKIDEPLDVNLLIRLDYFWLIVSSRQPRFSLFFFFIFFCLHVNLAINRTLVIAVYTSPVGGRGWTKRVVWLCEIGHVSDRYMKRRFWPFRGWKGLKRFMISKNVFQLLFFFFFLLFFLTEPHSYCIKSYLSFGVCQILFTFLSFCTCDLFNIHSSSFDFPESKQSCTAIRCSRYLSLNNNKQTKIKKKIVR